MQKCASLIILLLIMQILGCGEQSHEFTHTVVAIEKNKFHGWPANNGVWIWDDEILVGFTQVEFEETGGHNIKADAPRLSLLARSVNGGQSWKMFDPVGYVGDPGDKQQLLEPLDFLHDGFAMRVFGDTYHGTADPEGGFYYSYDRGHNWNGPFKLGDIADYPEFKDMILTPRTDYVILDKNECMIFTSARMPDSGMSDKTACLITKNGGLTFEFISWVVPLTDPYRAVMTQTVQISENTLVLVARRRVVDDRNNCWIDAYHSADRGTSWQFLGRVAETGAHNGNPPALVRLEDGRLCCVYGNRTKKEILGSYSWDDGKTWEPEFVIRTAFYTGEAGEDMKDLGYPRLIQRPDGKLVAIYYWATQENPEQHIAATIWEPL